MPDSLLSTTCVVQWWKFCCRTLLAVDVSIYLAAVQHLLALTSLDPESADLSVV